MPLTRREGNRVIFTDSFATVGLPSALACLYQAKQAGYEDMILDFTHCPAAFPAPVLSLCCQIMRLRTDGTDFEVLLPQKAELARLFQNANWAHLLAPAQYPISQFRGFSILPATHFQDAAAQNAAVNSIIDGILGATPDLARSGLTALEWSISEITDNVLVHSQSPIGGIIQLSTYQKSARRIEYVVVDAGIGIPATLRQTHLNFGSDVEALEQSIKEGVTRDSNVGQGNGLFGSYQVCSKSKGAFHLQSGNAKLTFTAKANLSVTAEAVPFHGTLVDAQVNLSDSKLLEEALTFKGRIHIQHADFVEMHYEADDSGNVNFEMRKETPSFKSRLGGTPVRNKLTNLLRMCGQQRVVIDFTHIPLVSSSFADEVFGKLFIELGPVTFSQRLEFRNVSVTVRQLIDRAIEQRLAVSSKQ